MYTFVLLFVKGKVHWTTMIQICLLGSVRNTIYRNYSRK